MATAHGYGAPVKAENRYGDGESEATRDLLREYRKSREQILRYAQDDRFAGNALYGRRPLS